MGRGHPFHKRITTIATSYHYAMAPTPAGILPTTTSTNTLHTIRLHRRAVRDLHHLHRAVEAATDTPERAARALWALPRPDMLIVRAPRLDPTLLPPVTAVSTTHTPIPPTGAHLHWALIANPTKSTPTPLRSDGTRPRGRRTPLDADDVPAWVQRKLAPALAPIRVADAARLPRLAGRHPRTGGPLVHTRWAITGEATVADQAALAHLLTAGVGPGKAFGCGLLTVREAR